MAGTGEPDAAQDDGVGVGEIEVGIPLPPPRGRKPGIVAQRIAALPPDGSFTVSTQNQCWQAHHHARKRGIAIIIRALEAGGWLVKRNA